MFGKFVIVLTILAPRVWAEHKIPKYGKPREIEKAQRHFDPAANGHRTLFGQSFLEMPSGQVTTVRSAGVVTGSLVRVCRPDTGDRTSNWYLTASHVAESSPNPVTAVGETLRLIAALPSADFALYETANSGPCMPVGKGLKLAVLNEAEMMVIAPGEGTRFSVEAWDDNTKQIRRAFHTLPLAWTPFQGIPGREDTGPLVSLGLHQPLGTSGGALVMNGHLAAMLLASELTGYQTVALSAPVIFRLLERVIAGDTRLKPVPAFFAAQGQGVNYFNLHAVHQRGVKVLRDSGSGRLVDSGSGRLVDSGRSRVQLARQSGLHYQGKRWLSNLDTWSEGESLPPVVRKLLRKGEPLEGIFEQDGKFYISSPLLSFPEWMPGLGAAGAYSDAGFSQKCSVLPASVNGQSTEIILPARIYICEFANLNRREIRVAVNYNSPDFKALLFRAFLEKNCGPGTSPCAIKFEAGHADFPYPRPLTELLITSRVGPEMRMEGSKWIMDDQVADITYWQDQADWFLKERLLTERDSTLGLRTIGSEKFNVSIDRTGAIRIVVARENIQFEFKGEIPQEQVQPEFNDEWVENLIRNSLLLQ